LDENTVGITGWAENGKFGFSTKMAYFHVIFTFVDPLEAKYCLRSLISTIDK